MQFKPMQRAAMRTLANAIDHFVYELRKDEALLAYFDRNLPVKTHILESVGLFLEAYLEEKTREEAK
ncbi:hypothetical protein CathTA2_2441 [Caldalkalibacillus thermarum TA2.A1]|uniref:Uncharacterized protein n=1 Tax=Caldalkalibacillus thermarum (strain TA2.A1) TaxID=986075 RepID=F5L9D6_CALTT|nr:hypothetical protein [Caldalkalibacillus thermarum]EGL82078.1 hypothetical protein CathTA2_2441 [Caldalkalibacillus thermarum TA2.A1]QZT34007.1 hypothetical protein HUR95_00775 [Caldalkalibacillus thermarum TA2.A1]